MTRTQFLQNTPFVVPCYPGFDWIYTENIFGGEVRISNGRHTQTIEIEQINEDYFVVECWLNRHTDGKIYFSQCEIK